MKMQWIKEQIEMGNYQLKLHAVERASIRGIDPLEVKEALRLNTLRSSLHELNRTNKDAPALFY
jgi:hypothetical protein